MRNLPVRADRIGEEIDALAAITEPDRPYTRRSFTPMFLRGRDYLTARFREAGLETRIDAAGNLIGMRKGNRPGLGTIMVGSHSDTVPDGGRFDGIAGVSAALEVARALADRGLTLDHDLEIVDFLAEEVSAFGVSCIGSRGLIGVLPPEWLERVSGDETLYQGIAGVGGRPDDIPAEKRTDIKAFLELHIEQGTVLEDAREDVGVVTAIAGITRVEIIVEGRADHAGTTRMGKRADALVAASELVLAIEALGMDLARGATHFAATVGEFSIEPNAANVVPSRARLLIDARAEMRPTMETFLARLNGLVADLMARRAGVNVPEPRVISDNHPTPGHPLLLDTLDAACDAVGAKHRRMASGAGHDTAWMARGTKSAMIFIPCLLGRSHSADESAKTEDVALGSAVLLETVLRLDKSLQAE